MKTEIIKNCTLHNVDCMEYMKSLPDNSFDLIVTSPPYNMRTRVRNGQYTTREKSEHFSKKYKTGEIKYCSEEGMQLYFVYPPE